MDHAIPSATEVQQRLAAYDYRRLQALASKSGVPFHTLLKIRSGETKNPGIQTVRAFVVHMVDGVHAS